MIGMVSRQFRRLWGALRSAPRERAEHYDKWQELAERKKRLDAMAAAHQAKQQVSASRPPEDLSP
ncbi:hypothetical protein GCM10007276_09060 [Agaricicola taiwanensis]|uniref:Uncharacterized protein n=1 Tax=Agaricicola taiwanensis TaxID=591372 RepID=A0A8J2YGB1_9RHOB|nr:hypothetical protein [Agaricicola taiwanensis]GGE33912.1 hypothetical protein GCM10007276_09060 [Agaricicola taiwanensis]